jgi:hypothetical protein
MALLKLEAAPFRKKRLIKIVDNRRSSGGEPSDKFADNRW